MEQERIGEMGGASGKLTKGMFSYLQPSVFSTVLWLVFIFESDQVFDLFDQVVCLEWSCFDCVDQRKMSWKFNESKTPQF